MEDIARLKLKVIPGASRDRIAEWLGDVLKVRVSAAPEKGKANAAVVKLLARELGLPESAVAIISGFTSPLKTVEVRGVKSTQLLQKLGAG